MTENNNTVATHEGEVEMVTDSMVRVRILSVSACASCQAHGKCGFADSREKMLDIPTSDAHVYRTGQKVKVHVNRERGLLAVWVAYVLPALMMISVAVGLSLSGCSEWVAILATFAVLGLYVAVLYLMRGRIGKRFVMTITPLEANLSC